MPFAPSPNATPDDAHDEAAGESRAPFTLDRANAALVYVRPIVHDIIDVYRDVVERREQLAVAPPSALPELESGYDHSMNRLGSLVDELQRAGVELRDFEDGVVAFHAEVDGRPAALIWAAADEVHDTDCDGVSRILRPGQPLQEAEPLTR